MTHSAGKTVTPRLTGCTGQPWALLIIHGDLGNEGPALPHPLYVRPVMRPNPHAPVQSRQEYIPEDALPCDLIHQAIRRTGALDGNQPPAAPTVRIINLSLGDPAKLFDRRMSAWARLLDWLSWEYNVLFLVSTGNSDDHLLLDVPHEGAPHDGRTGTPRGGSPCPL